MKLVVAAEKRESSFDAGFLIKIDKESLKRLKSGQHLYFFIDDVGDISHTCGIFKQDPTGNEVTNVNAFKDAALASFTVEPKRTVVGDEDQQDEHHRALILKGTRILPTYLDVKKVETVDDDYAFVTGKIYRAKDPRLTYLTLEEKTPFGSGKFDVDNVRVLPNGNFLNLTLSPYADEIEKLVDEQKEAFEQYSKLYTDTTPDPDTKDVWVSKYEHTRKLLKPHAHEIYKYQDDFVYYINSGGNWQAESTAGMKPLDIDDRLRIYNHLDAEGLLDQDMTDSRYQLPLKSQLEQRKLPNIAAALQPHIQETYKDDLDEFNRRKSKIETLKPHDGPLGVNELAGLKQGVTLFPHQSMALASLRDRDRMVVDADPGAGKALIIICDILQQMKAHKVKRPVVVMPESLLPQFANEVRQFSELNPWIISTDSISKWDGDFFSDAKKSPRNTVFLTSYNWISLDPMMVDNGEISEDGGAIHYRKSKKFDRVQKLLTQLKIDAAYLDECHVMKSNSNQARAALSLAGVPIVRGLTGTLMPGNPYDITGPFSAIHPSVFGTKDDFLKSYTMGGSIHKYNSDAPKRIRAKLKDFGVVSVRKSAWAHLLPKVYREFHYVDFTPNQKKAYSALLANILDEIRNDPKLSLLLKKVEDSLAEGDEITAGPLLARFTPLDVFLNAPAEAKDWLKALMLGDDAIGPKVKIINAIIHKHLSNPESGKVLVFVQYKESARNIYEHLSPDLKDKAAYFEGGMADVLTRFKDPLDPLQILVGVDKSLVVGHNIQAANCIINADLKWLSGDMYQREARAARNGQKRDVYIHNVLVKGSAEILKMAKLITAEHLISKSNSDFDDKDVLHPVSMSLQNMQTFTEDKQLHPYIERKKKLDDSVEAQSVKDRDLFGPSMMKPHGYTAISKVFKEAKQLTKVPSSKDFSGDVRDHDLLVAEDVESLPTDPKHPKKIALDLYQQNGSWFLFSYKSADPDGFLRRFGFTLIRGYYYLEVASKGAVDNIITRIEKSLTITNKPEFEKSVRESRVVTPGVKGGLRKASLKARELVAANVTEDEVKKKKGSIALEFSVFDGAPVIWTHDTLSPSDYEVGILRRVGFETEPPFWNREVTRSQLQQFLMRLSSQYPQLRVADWDSFKKVAQFAFKGINLDEFETLSSDKKKKK